MLTSASGGESFDRRNPFNAKDRFDLNAGVIMWMKWIKRIITFSRSFSVGMLLRNERS